MDATGSGPAEAMGSLKGCPAAHASHAGPATCSYSHPPRVPAIRSSSPTFMRLILPSAPPKVWPVTLGWHQMVKGSWLSRSSTRIQRKCPLWRSLALPIASTPSRHDTHPRCVLERPFLDSRCPILGFRAHAAKRHGRFISCHEQLSVMARQPPLLHTLALKSYPKRRSPSASASTLLQPAATRKGLTSLFGPKDQDRCDTVQFMDDQPAPDHFLPGYTRHTWVLPQRLD